MQYRNLLEQSRTILENKEQLDEGVFYRLPGHIIGNELYVLNKEFNSFYQSMINGNDYDLKRVNNILNKLKDITKEAKLFHTGDKVPVSYEYKKKNESVSEENVNEAKDIQSGSVVILKDGALLFIDHIDKKTNEVNVMVPNGWSRQLVNLQSLTAAIETQIPSVNKDVVLKSKLDSYLKKKS